MNKDFFSQNRSLVIIVAVVIVVAVVAGVMVTGNKSSGSSTGSPITLSSLSTRIDGIDTGISALQGADSTLTDNITNVNDRVDTIEENYTDVADNIDTLIEQLATVVAQISATPTPAPTPTPTASATPTPAPTPTPTVMPTPVPNHAPVINLFVVEPPVLGVSDWFSLVTVSATDEDGDALTFTWAAGNGSISGVGQAVYWIKSASGVIGSVGVIVSDGELSAEYSTTIVCN